MKHLRHHLTQLTVAVALVALGAGCAHAQDAAQAAQKDLIEGARLVEEQDFEGAIEALKKVTEAAPEYEPGWYYLGVAYYGNENREEAIEALNRAAALAPGRPGIVYIVAKVWEDWGDMHGQVGSYEDALTAYESAANAYQEELRIRRGKDIADVICGAGRTTYKLRRYREAIEFLERAVKEDRNFVEGLYWLGVALTANGEPRPAIRHLAKARDILEEWASRQRRLTRATAERRRDAALSEEDVAEEYGRAAEFATRLMLRPDLHKALGDAYAEDGQYAAARNAYAKALDPREGGNPTDQDAHTRIGVGYYKDARDVFEQQGLVYQPIQICKSGIRKFAEALKAGTYAPAHDGLGQVYTLQARYFSSDPERGVTSHTYDDAVKQFDAALAADQTYVPAMLHKGQALNASGQHAEAQQVLEQAVPLEPDNAEIYASLAQALVNLGQLEAGIRNGETALALDNRCGAAHLALGLAHYQQMEVGKATEHFSKAADLRPWDPDTHFYLGEVQFQLQAWHQARQAYRKSLEHISESQIANTAGGRAMILYKIGDTYLNTQAYPLAIKYYNESLALNPTDPQALMQSARARVRMKQFRAAHRGLGLAEKIAETDEDRSRVYALKAHAYEVEGKLHEALGAYSTALDLDANNFDAQQGVDRISARG